MTPAPSPSEEAERLAAVAALDLAAAEPAFERLARLAAALAGVPLAHVAMMQADGVWRPGVGGRLTPRDISVTARAVLTDQLVWIEDARRDPAYADNPFVVGAPGVRFFAAAPIRLQDGVRPGAICVGGPEAKAFDPELAARLEDLAALVALDCDRRRDLRELERAEAQARSAERLLWAMVEAAPVALAMTDRDMRFVHVSQRWRADLGMEGAEVAGRSVRELFPEIHRRWGEVHQRCLAGESVHAEQIAMPLPGGRTMWVRCEITPWRDAGGEVGGLLMMTHDVSDIVRSLRQVERSERRLEMAVEIGDLLVWELDFARGALQLHGARPEDFFGRRPSFDELAPDIWACVHPGDRAEAVAQWDRHVAEGTPYRCDHRLAREDGVEVWVSSSCEMVRGEDGRIERLVGVFKNITAHKLGEIAAGQARDAAEAANQAKSEFLAHMSHEIRTPLNGVLGVAGALARTELGPRQREMVELIEDSANTLGCLLNDVLDLARIESGHLELKDDPFDLEDAVGVVAALFRAQARAKGLDFAVTVAPAARGGYRGDVVRLRQILANLLSNAVKFTERGGVAVRVEVARIEDGERLAITVRDTGVGIPADVKARLFRRFEQGDGSITRRFGGSGLGLAISRTLAQAMGGELAVESAPGLGSSFRLTVDLPRQAEGGDQEHARPEPAQSPALEDAAPPRVLLAEDNPANRRVVSLILEAVGAVLTCVENGAEAVAAAEAAAFDLVRLDLQMPVMDGLTAIRTIRLREAAAGLAPTPIYALTANALPEHVAASRAAGADHHLAKPISATALIDAVRAAVSVGAAREARRSA